MRGWRSRRDAACVGFVSVCEVGLDATIPPIPSIIWYLLQSRSVGWVGDGVMRGNRLTTCLTRLPHCMCLPVEVTRAVHVELEKLAVVSIDTHHLALRISKSFFHPRVWILCISSRLAIKQHLCRKRFFIVRSTSFLWTVFDQ